MKEIGFWDYTCPRHGSLERYSQQDWDRLLDDMAAGGFNSLVLCVKWLTTGYRSRLSWLDQDSQCTSISSDNVLIHYAFQQARKRGMRLWLLAVVTQYHIPSFGIEPARSTARWGDIGMYDPDQPGIAERILELVDEIIGLFGSEVDGLIVEMEFCDADAFHRVPIYNQWAQANGRPEFSKIKEVILEPRSYPFSEWRDFTTDRRIEMLQRIEKMVRTKGFQGPLSTISEVGNGDMILVGNVNLARLRAGLPHWSLVTYDSIYDRRVNRLATMDFCVNQPHRLGFEVNFLTRGVMTFGADWGDKVDNLAEQWQMSLEDAESHQPERLWFMGSDARLDGLVCSNVKLPKWGFADGRTARTRLMQMASNTLGRQPPRKR
ncbi:MAG: hypothetical protein HY360_01115 [Verrucomicrobia bacterium]|nr:hypothetical protein [Verrucomicrobiota bacterium]